MAVKHIPQEAIEDKPKEFVPLTKAERRKKIFILVSALIVINAFVWGAFYFTFYKADQMNKIAAVVGNSKEMVPKPTPFPFQEITIHALRSREYKRNINERE